MKITKLHTTYPITFTVHVFEIQDAAFSYLTLPLQWNVITLFFKLSRYHIGMKQNTYRTKSTGGFHLPTQQPTYTIPLSSPKHAIHTVWR